MTDSRTRRLGVVLFPEFELLDVFGPLEMFGMLKEAVDIAVVAERKGPVTSAQGPEVVAHHDFADAPHLDLVLVPGGFGTRTEAENPRMLEFLRKRSGEAEVVMSVCTGSGLLASAGVLDGKRATTNKMFFQWVADQGPRVDWVKAARWVEDGKLVTSSGVSAGIDMSLAVIARLFGQQMSENLAVAAEYDWDRDSTWDPFAKVHGLVA
jgi:transcriptional regulator GlxA family with amidase domain